MNMNEIQKLEHICQYDEWVGHESLHPLVSVIDFSTCPDVDYIPRQYYGFYAVFLKDARCGDLRYGRQYYDYQQGTLVFFAPGQIVDVENQGKKYHPKGWGLLFDPELIKGTSLARSMKNYSFFSYTSNEALHLSEQERHTFLDCLGNIEVELHHNIDKHSKMLIASNIELLLNYCIRFYDRQFITRENVNKDILLRFEQLIQSYYFSDSPRNCGLLTVAQCADTLHLSANYFGDLIKKQTGKTAQEHLQMKLMDIAKEKILAPDKSISEVAYDLGFQYPQHFTRSFKQYVGCSPSEYRQLG